MVGPFWICAASRVLIGHWTSGEFRRIELVAQRTMTHLMTDINLQDLQDYSIFSRLLYVI